MVVKKRTAKVEPLLLDHDELHQLKASLSVDAGDDDDEDGDGVRQVAQTLWACLDLSEPVQQIQLIKKAGSQLEVLREEQCHGALTQACLHTLALIYVSLQAKNPLCRASASSLSSVPTWLQEQTVDCLSACLSDFLNRPGSNPHPHITDTIAACLDRFPLGERCINKLLPEVLQFLQKALSEYIQQNSGLVGRHVAQAQLMHSCLAVVKTSMLVLQRSQQAISAALQADQEHCALQSTLRCLLNRYIDVLTNEEFVQTVQSTAGMAVVLLLRSVITDSADNMASVVCDLLLGSVKDVDAAPCWLRPSLAALCAGSRPPGVSLYLCHGALAMLSWKGALQGPQWEELLLLVPHTLLELDTIIKESSTAMVVARVLTLWSGAALDCLQEERQPCSPSLRQSLCGGSALQGRLLEHVYSHWEHPLDGVRHQTRSLFRNLLLIHQHGASSASDAARDPYIAGLTQSLLDLEWHMRGKYGALGCLVELLGAASLLDVQPQLPSQLLGLMGDQTLAPYAGDLLERLFVSHKAQLVVEADCEGEAAPVDSMGCWHRTWVTPLLQVLCQGRLDQTTYILDYFMPKLLRCSPSSLAHMVQVLQDTAPSNAGPPGSRGAIGALMTCLRAARAQGVAPSSEVLLGGLVPLSLLRQALVHKHDQVRMDALGLLCETHRSTEFLTPQEVELLHHFLPSNLNNQSPGVRQQTVSLLKKLLCRVKDGGQLLQKRLSQERDSEQRERDQRMLGTYKDFLCWLCETLLDVLDGASFSTCLTSLHLLVLLAQLFTFSSAPDVYALADVVTFARAQNVLYCVGSNFLEVKQLASTLLRQLPPSAVALQDPQRMQDVLRAALNLSTSTKPYDSVTAAHLLKLLVLQPALPQTLLGCAWEQDLSLQPPRQAQCQASEAPEAPTMELNTLTVVQFLLQCLKQEVALAESSLLQAASSRPLYGRAHCITAVLQQLQPGSLVQTEHWRSTVTELISVCYRMSDVVSPVVQSSSPEGLIPMDTDSGSSAGLQKILQEIQPRDTNDFFTSARELEAQELEERTPSKTQDSRGGEGYRVTAQMVLVCCWRSMKEVAMLLGELCQSLPLHHTHGSSCASIGLITEQQVEDVGLYFRQQLLQSRHRGAFELAYVGFVRLTDMLCRSESRHLQSLPARWLSELLEEVKSSDPSSKLCATRRSAGIPFYIQALLSSEPKSSSCSLLKMTMRELIALAVAPAEGGPGPSTVPQVHALNILRALYRDTRLGENIIPFVSEGMRAAVLGFTSPVWAVRNSSTLLFSTLITRIFGVKKGKDEHSKKNRMTGREFFTRFPALYPFLLSQLEEAAATVNSDSGLVKLHPSLFLLLLVLGRLYPSPMDGSSSPLGLAPFIPFIIRCGRSAVHRTREMAAHALVPFVLVTQIPSTIHALLQELPPEPRPKTQQNHIHGTLLQVLLLLRSYQTDSHRPLPAGSGIGEALCQCMWLASRQNSCVVTRGAYLDVVVILCGPLASALEDLELRRETLAILMVSELVAPDGPPTTALLTSTLGPGAVKYLLSLAAVALSTSLEKPWRELWPDPELGARLLSSLLRCPFYEVRELVLEELLRRLGAKKEERKRRPSWLDQTTLSNLTSLVFHETRPQCLAKVLQVLCALGSRDGELPWRDGDRGLSQGGVLACLLSLARRSSHSVELLCAALTLASQLMVQLVSSDPEGACAACLPAQWGALVCGCCGEEQPVEVKLTAAEMLVGSTGPLLCSPTLPLGLSVTVSLWRSLLILLQDEDQEVRDSASDFFSSVPTALLPPDMAGVSVCPPVALDRAVSLLCRLFVLWGRALAGVLTLAEWLLEGEEQERDAETGTEELLSLDDDFLFEKGKLNLWAEPVQWVRLLHRHLISLVAAPDMVQGPEMTGPDRARLSGLLAQAEARTLESERALEVLPGPLPQFSCPTEHAQLVLQYERARLTLNVLRRLS